MRVVRRLLPADPADWHGFLRDYFCDKDAIAVSCSEDLVDLQLEWPPGVDRHVDPLLEDGLAWWGRGVTLGSMWSSRWRDGRILTSLFDTWTLHSWSEWLTNIDPKAVEGTVILHVDDHRDLGSPRLLASPTELVDAITGRAVHLRDPASIQEAIESGAIGMGSFMTPFVYELSQVPVRHLCQPPKVREEMTAQLVAANISDTLLHPGEARLAIDFRREATLGDGTSYVATSNACRWARDIESRRALVHIDMDYFNNRYDGDSAWETREDRLDPELAVMLVKVDELIDALASSRAKIEDVTIAYSPGFFPAEYWPPMDRRLRSGLARIL